MDIPEHSVTADAFAKGMVAWSEEDDSTLDTYREWQLDLIGPYLGKRILEIGAGNGRFAQALAERRSFERYTALEPSEHFFKGLSKISAKYPSFEVKKCTLDDLALECREKFDTVFSIHVLEHIENDLEFLKKCYSCLAPGGNLVILVPALHFLYSDLDKKIGHYRRYDKSMIRRLAKQLEANLVLNRYDNAIGALGWYWVCKIKKTDYHTSGNKKTLLKYYRFFSKYVLPFVSRLEKVFAPPLGLNLTAVMRKDTDRTVI